MKDDKKMNPSLIPTLNLAFIGDGVYDLLVRERLVRESNDHVGELNRRKVELVNCKAQAEAIERILPLLGDDEIDIFKRGRNANVKSPSKHSTLSDYHAATGLETLFGYLYLKGEQERINTLFEQIISA